MSVGAYKDAVSSARAGVQTGLGAPLSPAGLAVEQKLIDFKDDRDALRLSYENCFDIVTAARTLQWISRPAMAIARMKKAAKAGGHVVVLDYNHENNAWKPEPPKEFRVFYQAFLDWRKANEWDNRIADHIPELFQAAGLRSVRLFVEDYIVQFGDPDFGNATGIWDHVMQVLGPGMVKAAFLDHRELLEAEECYRTWAKTHLQRQSLYLRTVVGTVSAPPANTQSVSF